MRQSRQVREIPAFRSPEDEFEFWETHDPEDYADGIADDIVLAIKPRPRVPVTLRLDQRLVDDLKRIAEEKDVPYQTLARALLIQGVSRLQKARVTDG
jgi:predicted DNA binding CopG/RHH family protein